MSIAEWTPLETENGWPLQNELEGLRERLRDTAETLRIFCEAHDEMYVSGEPCEIYGCARAIIKRLKEEGLT